MIMELGCIAAGVPLGYLLRNREGIVRGIDSVLTWTVRLLLFLLGLALGADANLMTQLETLGTQGAVVSLFAVGGSLVVARVLSGVLHMNGKHAPANKAEPFAEDKAIRS